MAATVPNVPAKLSAELTDFSAATETITISAAIRPYSIAVTPADP